MTKKLTAIILSVVMLFAVMSVAVSAEAMAITPNKRISVTASYENPTTFTFVTEKTKAYIVTSYADDDVDPYCEINTQNESFAIDDSTNSTNFAEKFVFEAGVEYTLIIATYSEEDATFDIALECAHEWDEDTCVDCGKVCDHDAENARFKTCECGKVSLTAAIELGVTEDVTANGVEPIVRKFVPEEDVAAVLYSDVCSNDIMYDAYVTIFNASGDKLADNDDFNDSFNFVLWYEFEAGETYYIEVVTYYENLSFSFSLVKAAHTADDGAEHDVVFTEYQSGTCQEPYYTEGLYCAECDIYFAGHTEDGYGDCWDDDEDGYCDTCKEAMGDPDDDDEDDIIDDDDVIVDDGTEEPETGIAGYIEMIKSFIASIRAFILSIFAFFIYR